MSRLEDDPRSADSANMTPRTTTPSIAIPDDDKIEDTTQTSPVSMSSTGTGNLTTNGARVASPGQIGDDSSGDQDERVSRQNTLRPEKDEGHSNKAMSYPEPLLSAAVSDNRRGMSMPHSGLQRESSRSPSTSSNKKHKCPFCATDFTRHHNLKSHLLTHSHEKPFMCDICESRFRRLHDLKRHTKLHTGERPHVCPKCKRSFARGDALARHNKGQGGCAGRRSSVGSYGGGGSYDHSAQGGPEGMDGLIYTGEASHEPENMEDGDEDDDRRKSLPAIRHPDGQQDRTYQGSQSDYSHPGRTPSTYPPVANRQSTIGGLYPPNQSTSTPGGTHPSSPLNPNQIYPQSLPHQTSANTFSQTGMTESPKPLSPAGLTPHGNHSDSAPNILRNRSPSLTQQFQQQAFGRRVADSPNASSTLSHAPQLPSLPGLTPSDSRYSMHSQSHPPILQPPAPLPPSTGFNSGGPMSASASGPPGSAGGAFSSHSNSHSSHGTHQGSGERGNFAFMQTDDRLWAVIKALEQKVDELTKEVAFIKGRFVERNEGGNAAPR